MQWVKTMTVMTLVFFSVLLHAHEASYSNIFDLLERSKLVGELKPEDIVKRTSNDGPEVPSACIPVIDGIEMLCLKKCNVNSDCEKHTICGEAGFFGKVCLWKSCKYDDECEDPSICVKKEDLGICVRRCECCDNETCRYEKGRKTCECKVGFLENNGKCKECRCGSRGTCRFENGKKKCDCKPGFFERNGKCTDCICKGGKCVKEGQKSVCKCPPGYGNFTDDSCKACDCGPDTSCVWEAKFGGNKICLCKPGYSNKKGKCKVCDCGPDSNCEWISEGWLKPERKLCHCKPGFHEENGKCVEKWTANAGTEKPRDCFTLFDGIEMLCKNKCEVNSDCEKHMICEKSDHSDRTCSWKICEHDNECEYPSICFKFWPPKGFCVRKCNCEGDKSCKFEKEKEVCECERGFIERNGKCTDCICIGGTCVVEGQKRVCKCPPGYGNFTSSSCRACDCGPDTNCIWEAKFGGSKICLCKPGYSNKKGKCEVCDCGPGSNCEWISEGWLKPERKLCHCKMGFHEVNGKCVDTQHFLNKQKFT